MGQATVDLPDSIDLPPVDHVNPATVSAAALASADDLLSQLAGEDIDRLLAEAETAAHAPALAKVPEAELPPAAQPVEETVVFEKADAEAVAAPPEAHDVVKAQEAEEVQALQAMIEPSAAPPAETLPTTPTIAPAADATSAAPAQVASHFETSAAEVAALFAPSADGAASDESHVAGSPSILVRLLQVINSPVSWISDAVRDALGKVALLTLFNAVAVLVYVLVFRRHGR